MATPTATRTTLVITNDFPPHIGGIESFVAAVCELLDHDVVVLTSAEPGAEEHDARLPYPVVRMRGPLLPTPAVARRARELIDRHHCTRVVFGAAAPLGLLAPRLRPAGIQRMLAMTHGHETWWSTVPLFRSLIRRIGSTVDHVSYISEFTAGVIRPALSPAARRSLVRLSPPVDTNVFRPGARPLRPTALAAGRLVRQKGFDTLVEAWTEVVRRWPTGQELPLLRIVGEGPERAALEAKVAAAGLHSSVELVGRVAHADMPAIMAAAHVFALPVRTRRAGLNPEGLGLVFLEAASCGLAVIAGNSGGASETLVPGESGELVESDDVTALAGHLYALLSDLDRAERMGRVGRLWVKDRFSAERARQTLRKVLDLPEA
ncbi:glycosyltransferase family 4 protein [Mariniluteicoccus endophyticus]